MRSVENHRLRYWGIVGGALLILTVAYFSIQSKNQELITEKQYWQTQVELQRSEVQQTKMTTLMDLPTIIEECQSIFQAESVQVLLVNLDRIETGELSYALFHFKLRGSWSGIETTLQRLVNITDQVIQIQEVRLNPEGGDLLVKIYFYEPDKLSQP